MSLKRFHLNYQGNEYPINVKISKVNGGYSWAIEDDAFAFIDEIEIENIVSNWIVSWNSWPHHSMIWNL